MFMAAAIFALGTITSCSKDVEPTDPIETPDDPAKPTVVSYEVVATIGDDATRAALNDGESLKWVDGDNVVAWYMGADGSASYALREQQTIASIAEDGRGTFNFAAMPQGGKAWLAVGSNAGYDGCSAKKVEFNYNAAQSQAAAGAINPEYLRLVSNRMDVPVVEEGQSVVVFEVQFDIVGTILRFLPYSATGAYAAEQIKSVELVSVDNPIAGGGSAIARNYADFWETEQGYKWHTTDAAVFADEAVIFWDATSKSIVTTLTTPLSLDGLTSANTPGNGIYMCVPPVSVGGYKYVVTTDKAKYTFDASETAYKFEDNTLKNVLLDIEKATRLDLDAVKGELQYIGDLNAAMQTISCDGTTDKDGGYWYAQTRDTGADWVTREGIEYAHFYTGVEFECIDNATGEAADWLTVSYRTDGNTHWFMNVQPNANIEERSATVTATFPDVDGYIVTEACRTKSITVTQGGFTTSKILTLGGGVGDQVISGAGVDKLSLGWCVIAVNGTYAESWGDDKNNEQLLYSSVVIECREGAANGPIVDWLTVEYGKDANGKHNSTHLLATASENNTGAERKALVCCTYNAPEGYEFEGGATSHFKQFFVTQPANSGVKTVSFWGGIGADFQHDANAQQDWGLSYWVIKVDGADATDWGGDSHNEQLLYGSAEFKCYDYTNGVRGAEVDWVTVDYKRDGTGKVIDTWWLANIEANTGAARACEVVCTFPEHEGYAYENGQNVKTTIIRQAGVSTDEGGNDEPVVEGFSYTIFNNAADGSKGTGFGPGAGTVGDWYRFENITINGKTYTPGAEMSNLAANTELMSQLMAKAFSFGEITDDDVQIPGVDPLTTNPESFVTLEPWSDGGAAIYIRIVLTANDSGARRTFKIITKDGEGAQVSSVVYFQNN